MSGYGGDGSYRGDGSYADASRGDVGGMSAAYATDLLSSGGTGSSSSGSGGGGGSTVKKSRSGHHHHLSETDTNDNFKVVVRVRPPLPREKHSERGYADVVREIRHKSVLISENFAAQVLGGGGGDYGGYDSPPAGSYPNHRFTFDYVYDQMSRQEEVYKNTARSAVLSTLEGYNATILAYGQTGTGKTFTMEGFDNHELRGIIPRSVEEIFDLMNRGSNRSIVRASYLQIYNEVISDLLKPERSNLAIREDKQRGVFVQGLSEWVVSNPKEVYGLIKRGSAIRATGSTRMNQKSSRSHALFVIIVEQKIVSNNREITKVGKLNLVDLAGSERVSISGASGRRLEESKKINQSLSALGNVIAALTDQNPSRSHIPYRDSKLTRILEDSLGGNCKTTMMACISPALEAFLESLSTLKFANRAKNIKNAARVNEAMDEKTLLHRYERELKRLRNELAAKQRDVVDKRKLLELDEKRKIAEQDKLTALMSMERLSKDLMQEKEKKKRLEERIKAMASQMLGGGSDGPVQNTPAFQIAVRQERDRIRRQYQEKVSELERERETMEEEKAMTSRYKQLLLKQRDIMIQLTARLNERDQSILVLQEELESYDSHQRMMEDALDQKTAALIQLQKAAFQQARAIGATVDDSSKGGAGGGGKGAGTGAGSVGDGSAAARVAGERVRQLQQELAKKTDEHEALVRQVNEVKKDKASMETFMRESMESKIEREVQNRLKQELDFIKLMNNERTKFDQAPSAEIQRLQQQLRRQAEELAHARQSSGNAGEAQALATRVRELQEAHASKDGLLHSLREQNQALSDRLQHTLARQGSASGGADSGRAADRAAAMTRLEAKFEVQQKERQALKIIIEKKMKALVDSIATVAVRPNENVMMPSQTRAEIKVLQRLVNASLVALNQSDAQAAAAAASRHPPTAHQSSSSSAATSSSPVSSLASRPGTSSTQLVASSSTATSTRVPASFSSSTVDRTGAPGRASSSSYSGNGADQSAFRTSTGRPTGGGVTASPGSASSSSIQSIMRLIAERKQELLGLDNKVVS